MGTGSLLSDPSCRLTSRIEDFEMYRYFVIANFPSFPPLCLQLFAYDFCH